MDDPELHAMSTIMGSLTTLDAEARARVIWWMAKRFDISFEQPADSGIRTKDRDDVNGRHNESGSADHADEGLSDGVHEYEHFAELYDAVGPSTDAERVLIAAYWTQVHSEKVPFGSQELNKLLKDLGHGVTSINKAMSANIDKKPALVLQVSRSGSAQQARKKYKLTEAGKKWVDSRLI